jgi:RNA polymerase sigma-70 factor (ECF subfamily)
MIEDPTDSPEVALNKVERSAIIRKCLNRLSHEHREITDLVYYHEKSIEEVAQIVKLPASTVKMRMFYARKKLAEMLKAENIVASTV